MENIKTGRSRGGAFFLFALVALNLGVATLSAERIRVVTWNIQMFPSSPDQLKDAQEALLKMKPDVLLINEITNPNGEEVRKLVSVLPGFKVDVVSNWGKHTNQAVASRFPVDSAWYGPWKPVGSVAPPRGIAFAALDLGGGRFLLAYSLHMEWNRSPISSVIAGREEATRQALASIDQMLNAYGPRGQTAVVIGGDYNTSIDDDPRFLTEQTVRGMMKAGMKWAHEGIPAAKRVTIPGSGSFPDNCFDHLFSAGMKLVETTVLSFPKVSDHNPVIADFDAETIKTASVDPSVILPTVDPAIEAIAQARAKAREVADAKATATLDSADTATLKAAEGKKIAVQGLVSAVQRTHDTNVYRLVFEGAGKNDFVAIIQPDELPKLASEFGENLSSLAGKTVEVEGLLDVYRTVIPEIKVFNSKQLRIIKAKTVTFVRPAQVIPDAAATAPTAPTGPDAMAAAKIKAKAVAKTKATATLSVTDTTAIKAAAGAKIIVKGLVSAVQQSGQTKAYRIIFKGTAKNDFVAVVPADELVKIATKFGENLSSLIGQTVEIEGLIDLYRGIIPEIKVFDLEQIRIIKADTGGTFSPTEKAQELANARNPIHSPLFDMSSRAEVRLLPVGRNTL